MIMSVTVRVLNRPTVLRFICKLQYLKNNQPSPLNNDNILTLTM